MEILNKIPLNQQRTNDISRQIRRTLGHAVDAQLREWISGVTKIVSKTNKTELFP